MKKQVKNKVIAHNRIIQIWIQNKISIATMITAPEIIRKVQMSRTMI